jgi:hypothetical protein
VLLCAPFVIGIANADEPILITKSPDMNKIIFDGKWSFITEWKKSSLNDLLYNDGTEIYLRTAHQDNFVYVFVDAVSFTNFVKHSDRTIVCFDKNDSKTTTPNENDYCFLVTLDNNKPIALQGGSSLAITGDFKKIDNPLGFIGIASISDQNDRYTATPHPSYEFRIPTGLIGRSDIYGFYLGVYDTNSNKVYSWPQNVTSTSQFGIPSPSQWGAMISPDKSLPEFELPTLALLSSFLLALYFIKLGIRPKLKL